MGFQQCLDMAHLDPKFEKIQILGDFRHFLAFLTHSKAHIHLTDFDDFFAQLFYSYVSFILQSNLTIMPLVLLIEQLKVTATSRFHNFAVQVSFDE